MFFVFGIVFLNIDLSAHAVQTLYTLSPCTTLHSFHHFVGITVEDCILECRRRTLCAAVNYNNYVKHCALRNSSGLALSGLEPKWCFDVVVNNETIELDGPCNENPCNETSMCIDSSKPPFFRCIIVYCKSETDIVNASFRIKPLSSVGDKNELVCDKGFTPIGPSSVTCLSDGNWSSTDFECLKNCPSIPIKSSALVSSWSTYRFVDNTIATFNCKNGYYNITDRTIVCNKTGTWSEFECLPYCHQTDIVPIPNGGPTPGNIYTIFEQAKYMCNSGYYLSDGIPEITCGNDGKWSAPQVECYPFCQLPAVANGIFQNLPAQPIKKDVSVTYTCNSGYYTHPDVSQPTAVCLLTGEWQYAAACYKYCSDAPNYRWEKVEGYSTGAPYKIGTSVQYRCDTIAMHFTGSNVRNCKSDGSWDGEVHCCGPCYDYERGKCRCSCWPC
ncbi:sushi, von Willebrand factor type A, EGF and pentraxin domain-containing protein 1-like [Ruditapes philippinarum]|uniref:sushi, von Willebrand factor type A, EGF and pentraxin domain-containing protein 1-like n=1 Tax=Ruditapes philippinarum TaxID=129788 RepID=UPI00295BB7B4|nr:sushi, von Willebrand factor type A, EGF and pentraxin domain-containing protein 1-like [Ruditapes philippinarum]